MFIKSVVKIDDEECKKVCRIGDVAIYENIDEDKKDESSKLIYFVNDSSGEVLKTLFVEAKISSENKPFINDFSFDDEE